MLHNNASLMRYEVEARSSHYVILLVTCSESVWGEGSIFGLLYCNMQLRRALQASESVMKHKSDF